MKRVLIFIPVLAFGILAKAQSYSISFAGTGASATVSTVKVENLTSGTSLTLNGDDILSLSIMTGFKSIDKNQISKIKIYPNPMTNISTFEICPPVAGNAVISIFDVTGKQLHQIKSYLDISLQKFSVSGLNAGVYFLNIKGVDYQLSGKLLCNSKSAVPLIIKKISNNQVIDTEKSKTDNKGVQTIIDMEYTMGDRLIFTGTSGNYSTVKTDIPTQDKTITFNFISCIDADNNNYPVVEVGPQTWMAENLKTTKYKDGISSIPNVTEDAAWLALYSPAYCWYDNNGATFKNTYGALYNWYAVNTGNLCPIGWHVPTDPEWTTLITYLSGTSVAGGKIKETGTSHWNSPNTGATNESGLTALPGGYRHLNGTFSMINVGFYWWSATEFNSAYALALLMTNESIDISRNEFLKNNGYYIRCLKDN